MVARIAVVALVAPALATLPPFEALKTFSGLGSVPFVSLPQAMGPLDDWGLEWWYYSGVAITTDGAALSLQFELFRNRFGGEVVGVSVGGSVLGIGIPGAVGAGAAPRYAYAAKPGLWVGGAATWDAMDARSAPGLRARLVGGYAGVAGATYVRRSLLSLADSEELKE